MALGAAGNYIRKEEGVYMKGKKIDLMPCPHCGGAIAPIDDNRYCSYGELPNLFWVVCKMCGAQGGTGINHKEAVKKWNRRVPPA